MSQRSTRRAARGDSSSDQSHLADRPASTSLRRNKEHSPDADSDTDRDDDEQASSRRARDVEQGGGGGGRRWAMQSLPAARRGGAGQDPEPLVRASKKTPSSQAQGRYAPIAQGDPAASSRTAGAGTSDHSDLEHSPPYSDDDGPHSHSPGESDVEKQAPSSRRLGSKKGKRAPAAANGDGHGDDGEVKGGMTKKRWLLVGGGAILILVLVIAVIAVYMNSKSDTSSAESESAEDSSPSLLSKSVSASGSSEATSATAASESGGASGGATASGGSSSAGGASGAPSSSAQIDPASASAAPSPSSAASLVGSDTRTPSSESIPLGGLESTTAARATAAAPAATFSAATAPADGASLSADTARPYLDSTVSVVPRPAARPTTSSSSAPSGGAVNAGWTGSTQTSSSADQNAVSKVSTTATWFAADQHLSACQETFSDADLVAAVSSDMFGSDGSTISQLCGAELTVWQPDSDVTISVKIGDVCTECPTPTAIDLSQSAFLALAPGGSDDIAAALNAGVLSVQWWFTDSKVQQSLGFGFREWAAGASEA